MTLEERIQHKIDGKTKPLGALGKLESLAFKIAKIQNTESPVLSRPQLIVFAGDHGIAKEGVSAYPAEVTPQMVLNFLNGGAAINVFCNQNKIKLTIVDAGVNADFDINLPILNQKIAYGTRSFLSEKAMSKEELNLCFDYTEKLVQQIDIEGTNVIGFGEMGIANTSSAAMIVHALSELSLEQSVGRGTGLDDEGLKNKIKILEQAKNFHGELSDPMEVLQTYGGYEVAQMTAAMLSAFRCGMIVLVDGYIATAAFLVAYRMEPEILNHAIFCHCSNESGHRLLLEELGVEAVLDLGLRLGEGTGCALAYPILQSAVNFLNEMASFDSAGVSNKS